MRSSPAICCVTMATTCREARLDLRRHRHLHGLQVGHRDGDEKDAGHHAEQGGRLDEVLEADVVGGQRPGESPWRSAVR